MEEMSGAVVENHNDIVIKSFKDRCIHNEIEEGPKKSRNGDTLDPVCKTGTM